jgi:phosphoribosyl 1,2-cyclic phosphodiesterase
VRVHLCGVRGSTPAPGADFLRYGGHTSCVAISHDDAPFPTLILDAGTGIRSVTALLDEQAFSGTILLTHLHWDHVQGLPFFHAGDRDDSRVSLSLPEQEDGADAVSVLARSMSPPHFPMEPDQLRGSWSFATIAQGEHELDGFTVLAREIPHKGGRTFGYRVSDGASTFTYMPDHCPTSLGAGPDGYGEYHPTAVELVADTDALLHDSQLLTPQELTAEGRFGHAIADYAVELGRRAKARSVLLAHHRPDRDDDALDELAGRFANASGVDVIVAAQDSVLQL